MNYQEPKSKGGRSLLHYAVMADNRQLVNLLVKNYADVLVKDTGHCTPMHYVCSEKGNTNVSLEIFKILLGKSYEAKDARDLNKRTPMDYAEEAGNTAIV